jgi:hypothetical protein
MLTTEWRRPAHWVYVEPFDLSTLIVVCMGLACGLIILATITWIIE